MTAQDAFSACHPLINFLYFALVPVPFHVLAASCSLAISLLCAFAYAGALKGGKAVRISLRCLLPMMLLAAVVNPAFNHAGITILTYLPSGNPLTFGKHNLWHCGGDAGSGGAVVSLLHGSADGR